MSDVFLFVLRDIAHHPLPTQDNFNLILQNLKYNFLISDWYVLFIYSNVKKNVSIIVVSSIEAK